MLSTITFLFLCTIVSESNSFVINPHVMPNIVKPFYTSPIRNEKGNHFDSCRKSFQIFDIERLIKNGYKHSHSILLSSASISTIIDEDARKSYDHIITTPHEVLKESLNVINKSSSNSILTNDEINSISYPLDIAKMKLEQSLYKIIKQYKSVKHKDKSNKGIIKITQKISHEVNILHWIHSQKQYKKYDSIDSNYIEPKFYLGNVEGSLEIGGYGSSYILSSDNNESEITNKQWEFIKNLPKGVLLCGGGRFDSKLKENIPYDEDLWNDFGGYYYMLPSIELRKDYDGFFALSVNLYLDGDTTLSKWNHILHMMKEMKINSNNNIPLLPPILSRFNVDSSEYENGVQSILDSFNSTSSIKKVVLARSSTVYLSNTISNPMDILIRLKQHHSNHGHLYYLQITEQQAFLGCTPERLFRVASQNKELIVKSEALAGTRPRGRDAMEDTKLLQELISSQKDVNENHITKEYIQNVFRELYDLGKIVLDDEFFGDDKPFVRRTRHLQHLCQEIKGVVNDDSSFGKIYHCTESTF